MSDNTSSKANNEVEERKRYYPFWAHVGIVLLEPIVLAFFIFLLFTRIQQISKIPPNISVFWQLLNQCMKEIMILIYPKGLYIEPQTI